MSSITSIQCPSLGYLDSNPKNARYCYSQSLVMVREDYFWHVFAYFATFCAPLSDAGGSENPGASEENPPPTDLIR
jgi:hypothetical protein